MKTLVLLTLLAIGLTASADDTNTINIYLGGRHRRDTNPPASTPGTMHVDVRRDPLPVYVTNVVAGPTQYVTNTVPGPVQYVTNVVAGPKEYVTNTYPVYVTNTVAAAPHNVVVIYNTKARFGVLGHVGHPISHKKIPMNYHMTVSAGPNVSDEAARKFGEYALEKVNRNSSDRYSNRDPNDMKEQADFQKEVRDVFKKEAPPGITLERAWFGHD